MPIDRELILKKMRNAVGNYVQGTGKSNTSNLSFAQPITKGRINPLSPTGRKIRPSFVPEGTEDIPYAAPDYSQKQQIKYQRLVTKAEREYSLPEGLLNSVLKAESGFNPKAVSSAGAKGIAQIIPEYHPEVNPMNPREAIPYSAKYLAENYNRFGSWDKALAAYNWGPTNVARHGMKKLPPETIEYINKVLGR